MDEHDISRAFTWPLAQARKTADLAQPLYKPDMLLEAIEGLRTRKLAWAPVTGTTKRTETADKLRNWITRQNKRLAELLDENPAAAETNLGLEQFPKDPNNPLRCILSISRNIVYLIDQTSDFLDCVEHSFGVQYRMKTSTILNEELPIFLYVTNSVTHTGRAFKGDPFTGQLAAYAHIFGRNIVNERERYVVCYYPHQLWSQFFDGRMQMPRTKGTAITQSVSDLLFASFGVPIDPKKWCLV